MSRAAFMRWVKRRDKNSRTHRQAIASFINADFEEIIFVRNCTEGINLVADNIDPQSHVICSDAEHHSNYLPWTRFKRCSKVNIGSDGSIDLDHLHTVCNRDRPELIAFALVSNALGTIQPWQQINRIAKSVGAKVLIDASQWVSHRVTDVTELDCDFLCFSGHKMCGPSGIGVLYGKRQFLDEFSCKSVGGGMVTGVHADGHELHRLPYRLEAGTPNIEGAIGLAAACRYLNSVGLDNANRHVRKLTEYCLERLSQIPEVSIVGPRDIDRRGAIVSFNADTIEANGIARILSDRFNIIARSGYHCAQPAHQSLGLRPTVRVSFSLYNAKHEINCLAEALQTICSRM